MKRLFFLWIIIFSNSIFAEDVEVTVEPREGIVNENFYVTFKIKTSGSEEPYISFTPSGASVLGKNAHGLSISTVVINGKFTTTKEQSVVYELLAERAGQVYLRNIKVEMNGKTIPVKEVKITILNEARRIPDAFIEAETSKTKVYLGEGLDVNYYLYFKTSISANDVKEFPKLNKFIKRFHHINSPVETVQYRGQIYRRILAYSARLFPEKIGAATLDPMKISVQIVENEYGGFGFGSQRYKNKDLSSQPVSIEVLPLPKEGVPASFTGLVGEHEFNLTVPKTKYLVNEPIEIKLEVKGKGALENLDTPVIFEDKNLESFDTKTDVTELGTQAAKKSFEYTMLARGPLKIEGRKMSLAYFDPETSRYIEKKIEVPALEVEGQGVIPPTPVESQKKERVEKSIEENKIALVGPILRGQEKWYYKFFLVLNTFLGAMLLTLVGMFIKSKKENKKEKGANLKIKEAISHLKNKGINYSDLYKVLAELDKEKKMSNGGVSIRDILNESTLKKETKEYFKNALSSMEGGTFAKGSTKEIKKINFDKKHFNELIRNL